MALENGATLEMVENITDMYHIGEYMVWTDGTIKKCLRDTVYSPEEYAADWGDAE